MAREKDGYRDALERIRSQASGELVTVKEAARIVYGDDTYASVRCIYPIGLDYKRTRQANPRNRSGPPDLLNPCKPFSQPHALSHAQGHHLSISAQSFAGYKSLFLDYRSSRASRSIRIRHERRNVPVHEIGREQKNLPQNNGTLNSCSQDTYY